MNVQTVTAKNACERLGICRTSLYGLCKAGQIRTIKIGKRGIRIPVAEIERFINEQLSDEADQATHVAFRSGRM